jgi:hypothetical protein
MLKFSDRLLPYGFADPLYCFSDFALRLSEPLSNLTASVFRIAFILHFPISQSATDFSFHQTLCLVQLPLYFILIRQSHKTPPLRTAIGLIIPLRTLDQLFRRLCEV